MENKKGSRGNFSGGIGFVMAAAGSAVGLGNIWRFPYLAAKHEGGAFIAVYILLALTFGFTLLTAEIAIGRRTKQGPLTAFGDINPKFKANGLLSWLVPILILPYYCTIGGWVLKYLFAFITGSGFRAAEDGYFAAHITSTVSPIVWLVVFLGITAFVVFSGVDKGIEKYSKILMPILLILIIFISIYSITLSYTDESGVTRTGLQGLAIYLIPNFAGMNAKEVLQLLLDAVGQLFYSISVAMGIMIAYGSYVKDDTDLMKSINMIEIFDTLVALLAGMMIVPAVYTFMGKEGMTAGPGLMFVSLPKVFEAMGTLGIVVGALFFIMVTFAAVTSSVSIMEAIVSGLMDKWHMNRVKSGIIVTLYALIVGTIVCLGYNVLYFEYTLPNGSVAQILDVLDYVSNSVLMPISALFTCILIGWVVKPDYIIEEVTKSGSKFGRKGLFIVMIKFIAPLFMLAFLLQAAGIL